MSLKVTEAWANVFSKVQEKVGPIVAAPAIDFAEDITEDSVKTQVNTALELIETVATPEFLLTVAAFKAQLALLASAGLATLGENGHLEGLHPAIVTAIASEFPSNE